MRNEIYSGPLVSLLFPHIGVLASPLFGVKSQSSPL